METATPRQNKVARLIQKDLAEMLQVYARSWFQGSLITVTIVRISPDLSVAKVYLSIFPDSKKDEIMKTIQAHNKEIRFQLGQRIGKQVRIIPELIFNVDDSLEYLENIENLLKK
ncbi:MAG: 30S ribosome-binding factor RbfA [Salinivirgaceae bacterium]|nr:30S ribosome-binding factor RbfA [Salinivirgaceae bacterium]